MNNNFDAWAEKRYPLASRQDSLGGFSRDMRKSALEGFEVATALSGVVIAKQSMQLKALAADNQRLREAVAEFFAAKQEKENFERDYPHDTTKRWRLCLERAEASELAMRAALAGSKDGDL